MVFTSLMPVRLRGWVPKSPARISRESSPARNVWRTGEVILSVVKNGKVEKPDYQVDGISGGTITSVGVDAMLKACLSSYKNFLTNNNEEE